LVLEGLDIGRSMDVVLPLDEDGNKIVRIGHSPDPDDAFMFHAMIGLFMNYKILKH
jgi:hypothetical protein